MLSVEEAIARLLQQAYPIDGTESLSLEDAHLRLLAEDCRAAVDVPPADNSAMDGYACHLAETAPAGLTLPITQTAAAGSAPQPLQPGTAARIFTGAEIPPGANCVIMQENCAVESPTLIAFGSQGTYAYRTLSGHFMCDAETFGLTEAPTDAVCLSLNSGASASSSSSTATAKIPAAPGWRARCERCVGGGSSRPGVSFTRLAGCRSAASRR